MSFGIVELISLLLSLGGFGVAPNPKPPTVDSSLQYGMPDADIVIHFDAASVVPGNYKVLTQLPDQPQIKASPELAKAVRQLINEVEGPRSMAKGMIGFDPVVDLSDVTAFAQHVQDAPQPTFIVVAHGKFTPAMLEKVGKLTGKTVGQERRGVADRHGRRQRRGARERRGLARGRGAPGQGPDRRHLEGTVARDRHEPGPGGRHARRSSGVRRLAHGVPGDAPARAERAPRQELPHGPGAPRQGQLVRDLRGWHRLDVQRQHGGRPRADGDAVGRRGRRAARRPDRAARLREDRDRGARLVQGPQQAGRHAARAQGRPQQAGDHLHRRRPVQVEDRQGREESEAERPAHRQVAQRGRSRRLSSCRWPRSASCSRAVRSKRGRRWRFRHRRTRPALPRSRHRCQPTVNPSLPGFPAALAATCCILV